MERRLLYRNAGHVDHHDGGHDGSLRDSYDFDLRLDCSKGDARRELAGCPRNFRSRLPRHLDPFFARGDDSSVGVRSNGFALANDNEQQQYSRGKCSY
jgi:hypothetical protein